MLGTGGSTKQAVRASALEASSLYSPSLSSSPGHKYGPLRPCLPSLPFSLTLPPTRLHPSPRTLHFGLTLCGSICLGCKVAIKEVLKEIWKENEGGFMMLGGEFCYGWEQCRTKRRADLIYRKSLLE